MNRFKIEVTCLFDAEDIHEVLEALKERFPKEDDLGLVSAKIELLEDDE